MGYISQHIVVVIKNVEKPTRKPLLLHLSRDRNEIDRTVRYRSGGSAKWGIFPSVRSSPVQTRLGSSINKVASVTAGKEDYAAPHAGRTNYPQNFANGCARALDEMCEPANSAALSFDGLSGPGVDRARSSPRCGNTELYRS
ncbi:hypothetical protein GWI33_015349 [Rhynchophorus ferrugineus]|uniref:Uncharacterized protein n=1 Tax=Rhynchophorus ferrugineus TaxID=354439 RepID=A0A834I5J9_RHYFE|nr:hypothetical protein GWI33_015349 [Rhynchophorus ferrugineus]